MAEEQARRQALELERKKKLEEEKAASVKSAPVASEGKAVSGVTSHYESMHSGSDAEEADTVPPHTDKSDTATK
eukprot:jgi/Picre1/28272/NNA_003678.t1